MSDVVKLCLENYRDGKGELILPTRTETIAPETREIGRQIYHRDKDGLWQKGPGRSKEVTVPTLPRNLATEAAVALIKTHDPRYNFQSVLEVFAANTEDQTHDFRRDMVNCQTKEDVLRTFQAHKIDIRTFDGEKFVGILPKQKTKTPEGPEMV